MSNDFLRNNKVYIRFTGSDFYLEKNKIILDKTCPFCKKVLVKESDFCDCGFFLKAAENSRLWGAILVIFFIIGLLFIVSIVNIDNARDYVTARMQENHMNVNSLTPIKIQVISSLKDSSYDGYIQSTYTKPKEDHKLMVLIKPTLWYTLTKEEKNGLLGQLTSIWNKIYRQNYPDSTKKPE